MKKNKRQVYLTLFLSLSIVTFLFINPVKKKINKRKNAQRSQKMPRNLAQRKASLSPKRAPASTKTKKTSTAHNLPTHRDVIGDIKPDIPLVYTNQVNESWKESFEKAFLRHSEKDSIKNFTITTKRSVLKVINNAGTFLEHIVVSYTQVDGSPFSFEAMVNSETGTPIQIWNRTRRESKKSTGLQAGKYKYYEN